MKGNFVWKLSIYLCISMCTDGGNSGALQIFADSDIFKGSCAVTWPSLGKAGEGRVCLMLP